MPDDSVFHGALYIRTRWVQVADTYVSQGYYNWCVASIILNGREVLTRVSRQEWSGDMADRSLVRRSAVSLVKNELALRLSDIREDKLEPGQFADGKGAGDSVFPPPTSPRTSTKRE